MIRRLFLLDSDRKPLACGRLHSNALDEAQVRFMAVDENSRSRLRSRILEGLEAEAAHRGVQRYAKHGYAVVSEAETLFGAIRHVRMAKSLP